MCPLVLALLFRAIISQCTGSSMPVKVNFKFSHQTQPPGYKVFFTSNYYMAKGKQQGAAGGKKGKGGGDG